MDKRTEEVYGRRQASRGRQWPCPRACRRIPSLDLSKRVKDRRSLGNVPVSLLYLLAVYSASIWISIGKVFTVATYTYQEYPVTKLLGECVDLKAKAFYRKTNGTTNAKTRVIVQWKKDTRSITDNGRISVSDGRLTLFEEGLRLRIENIKMSDSAYYEVTVLHPTSNIIEKTNFWLTAALKCPSGWNYVKGVKDRCYKYFPTPKSWTDAQSHCAELAGNLATIQNGDENNFVGNLLASGNGGWVGLNDRTSESHFVWNYDKSSSISYSSWANDEPNNYNGKCNIENCIAMQQSTGQWSDMVCNAYLPYVCERPKTRNGSNADWTCSDTKCYKYFEDPLIWEDAEKRCVDRNGNLATIQNTAENSMVTLLLQRNAWIGLNDLLEAGVYVWNDVKNLQNKASYTNWASNEPNDRFYQPGHIDGCSGEDCVQMIVWRGKATWYDAHCGKKIPYVCEKVRDRYLTTGVIIGITIGCMIGLAVIAGIINAAVRKRNKAHVKALIQSAYKQENTEMQGRMADKEERAPDYKVIVRQKMEKRKKSRVASIS